jgi:hypothetical protein
VLPLVNGSDLNGWIRPALASPMLQNASVSDVS